MARSDSQSQKTSKRDSQKSSVTFPAQVSSSHGNSSSATSAATTNNKRTFYRPRYSLNPMRSMCPCPQPQQNTCNPVPQCIPVCPDDFGTPFISMLPSPFMPGFPQSVSSGFPQSIPPGFPQAVSAPICGGCGPPSGCQPCSRPIDCCVRRPRRRSTLPMPPPRPPLVSSDDDSSSSGVVVPPRGETNRPPPPPPPNRNSAPPPPPAPNISVQPPQGGNRNQQGPLGPSQGGSYPPQYSQGNAMAPQQAGNFQAGQYSHGNNLQPGQFPQVSQQLGQYPMPVRDMQPPPMPKELQQLSNNLAAPSPVPPTAPPSPMPSTVPATATAMPSSIPNNNNNTMPNNNNTTPHNYNSMPNNNNTMPICMPLQMPMSPMMFPMNPWLMPYFGGSIPNQTCQVTCTPEKKSKTSAKNDSNTSVASDHKDDENQTKAKKDTGSKQSSKNGESSKKSRHHNKNGDDNTNKDDNHKNDKKEKSTKEKTAKSKESKKDRAKKKMLDLLKSLEESDDSDNDEDTNIVHSNSKETLRGKPIKPSRNYSLSEKNNKSSNNKNKPSAQTSCSILKPVENKVQKNRSTSTIQSEQVSPQNPSRCSSGQLSNTVLYNSNTSNKSCAPTSHRSGLSPQQRESSIYLLPSFVNKPISLTTDLIICENDPDYDKIEFNNASTGTPEIPTNDDDECTVEHSTEKVQEVKGWLRTNANEVSLLPECSTTWNPVDQCSPNYNVQQNRNNDVIICELQAPPKYVNKKVHKKNHGVKRRRAEMEYRTSQCEVNGHKKRKIPRPNPKNHIYPVLTDSDNNSVGYHKYLSDNFQLIIRSKQNDTDNNTSLVSDTIASAWSENTEKECNKTQETITIEEEECCTLGYFQTKLYQTEESDDLSWENESEVKRLKVNTKRDN